ncbi:hypothetical protein SADUNF_Sadunf10G0033400 [Salix dunnii]|uniref:Uncharacterized protein n=1 Tax=Salix dunnii TaxID=1413687 RepID=A0A835JQ38_9ROSI|nr:hypothetical protein SADUNF_Sadunf10G0033400 [Salix dunnii]
MISDQASFPPTQNHANSVSGLVSEPTAVFSCHEIWQSCIMFCISIYVSFSFSQENPGEDQEHTRIHEQKDAY